MNRKQLAVLNTPEAMAIITNEAVNALAVKFETDSQTVQTAIAMQQPKVLTMMKKFMLEGINIAADQI